MRVLVLGTNQESRYNVGHQLFKNEIARQSNSRFYGPGHKFWDTGKTHIQQILRLLEFAPDVIVTYMGKYCRWIRGLKETKIPKVHIVIDYFPWNYGEEDSFIVQNGVDVAFLVCTHEVRAMRRRLKSIRSIRWLPFSVDTGFFRCTGSYRGFDVTAVMSTVDWCYPTRKKILSQLEKRQVSGFVRASWPKTRLMPKEYVSALCRSKISINGVDRLGSLNWKFLEGPACGAMLLTEPAGDMEAMGFKDGANCVVFRTMAEFEAKLQYYLVKEDERDEIAYAGNELVHARHSNNDRVLEFFSVLEEEFGLGEDDGRAVRVV